MRVVATTETPTRWLDDAEMRAWRLLMETTADLSNALEADLQRSKGISLGDYQVLVFLSEAPERRMRMCDLAARLHLSPSGLTRRLDGLVREGMVERVPSADDRRVLLAVLSDAGWTRISDAAPAHVDSVRRRLLDPLSSEQVGQLGDIFAAVHAGLDAGD